MRSAAPTLKREYECQARLRWELSAQGRELSQSLPSVASAAARLDVRRMKNELNVPICVLRMPDTAVRHVEKLGYGPLGLGALWTCRRNQAMIIALRRGAEQHKLRVVAYDGHV